MGDKVKRGSHMSDRQLAGAVHRGRQVQFIFLGQPTTSVTGWVSGWDDFHWRVITDTGRRLMIHKATVYVELLEGPDVEVPEKVQEELRPFQEWVTKNYFGQGSAS